MGVEPALGQEQRVLRVVARGHGARRFGPISARTSALTSAPTSALASAVAGGGIGRRGR